MAKKITIIIMAAILTAISFSPALSTDNSAAKLNIKVDFGNRTEYAKVVEDLAGQGDAAVADLLSVIKTAIPVKAKDGLLPMDSLKAKVTAMDILGEIQNPAALPLLKTLICESLNNSEIYNSARTIGNIGGPVAYTILEKILKDSQSAIEPNASEKKKAAIIGLGLCGNNKAIPLLKAELNNTKNDTLTRIYASASLGLLGSKDGYYFAVMTVNSTNLQISSSAIKALGLIGNPEALKLLHLLEQTDDKLAIRKTVLAAIIMIESSKLTGDDMVNHLENALFMNPSITELARWGTEKLKKVDTKKSRSALSCIASIDSPVHFNLRHFASLKIKTMKKNTNNN